MQGQTRMATLAGFATVDNELPFYVFNTHYDERGLQSRTEGSRLILKRVNELVAKSLSASDSPPLVFLVGDLNSPDTEEGYRTLTGSRYISHEQNLHSTQPQPEKKNGVSFLDSRHELHTRIAGVNVAQLLAARYGDWLSTFTGFGEHDHRNVIDVVLAADTGAIAGVHSGTAIGKKDGEQKVLKSSAHTQWMVTRYGVVPNRFEGGFLVSDHRLVVATFKQTVVGMPE
jgi:endonuclease/exonuclease/phosphatase family metal-dependent hydrolase